MRVIIFCKSKTSLSHCLEGCISVLVTLVQLICHLRSWAGPQGEHLPFERDELCEVVFHVLLLSLLPGSYLWYLLFTFWEVICPQAVAISGCHPVPAGQAPFPAGRVVFSL